VVESLARGVFTKRGRPTVDISVVDCGLAWMRKLFYCSYICLNLNYLATRRGFEFT
jgi:hypothetical protein